MTDEQKAISQVLRLLLVKGREWARRVKTEETSVAKSARFKFDPINEAELRTYLLHRGPTGRFGDRDVIYVKPPLRERNAFAAVWCRWDFELERPRCGFHFGVWFSHTDRGEHTAFQGYRYETPEVGDNHNYYHAQPCNSMATHQEALDEALPLSDRYPTFPVAANSSVELLLCLVTSIHGMEGLRELQSIVREDPQTRGNEYLIQSLNRVIGLQYTVVA